MAGAGPASNDVWHHSLEDLLQAIETAEASTSGSFVINLQSGTVPLGPPAKEFPRFERLRVYQLARTDEDPPRFQLRLGVIQSDLEADAILASVRRHYPNATKEKVAEADRKALASPAHPAPSTAAARPASAPSVTPIATSKPITAPPTARPHAVPTGRAPMPPGADELQWRIDELLPSLTRSPLPQRQPAPRPVEASRAPQAARAAPVGPPGRSSADSDSLRSVVDRIGTLIDAVEAHEGRAAVAQPQPAPATQARTASQLPAPAQPRTATQPLPAAQSRNAPPSQAPIPTAAPTPLSGSPDIDSTQTVRALTVVELADTAASCWYAIQLMDSDSHIDAEQVPNLDIFTEYRLYSVLQPREGGARHALRVGFFSSEVAAEAVAGYLSAYFPNPTAMRISVAERERFAEKLVVARKDVGAAGGHAVIEFVAAPPLPGPRIEPPSESAKRSKHDPANPSLWSRLRGLRAQG